MQRHIPVLAQEIYEHLPENFENYFDGTLGHGGHVQYILSNLEKQKPNIYQNLKVIGVDKDELIISKAKSFLNTYKNKISFIQDSYANLEKILYKNQKIDFFLLDLGVNLEHFKDASRGFSIKNDGELDMRFDTSKGKDARRIIEQYSLEKLSQIFNIYGDFRISFATRIATEIINQRKKTTITRTLQLVDILKKIGLNDQKIAVIFQCIRIEANQELDELKLFLQRFPAHISKNGICAIITYHSIEDSIVKYAFKELIGSKEFELINKHVIKPTYKETQINKASRSAKLRLIKHL